MKNKISKNYRINPIVLETMEEVLKIIKVKRTTFVEIALIEKLAKLDLSSNERENLSKYITSLQNELEKASKRLNKGI